MKKRYTSDPKQASRRNAFTNNLNNKRIFLTLLAFLLLGGEMAWAQVWSPDVTSETTYYIRTATDNNGNPVVANSTYGTYKFQYKEGTNGDWSSAQDYITEFVVNCDNTSDCVKLIFQTTHPVGFMNQNVANKSAFTVKNGILQMELGTGYESTVTLKRVGGFDCNQNTSAPFFLAEEAGDATKKQLIIKGNSPTLEEINNVVTAKGYAAMGYNPTQVWQDTCTFLNTNQFVIDGGYTFSNASWDESTGALSVSGSGGQGKLSLFRLQTGTLELTNVTIQNARNSAGNSGIHLMTNYGSGRYVALKMTHCWMDHFYAPNYPGLGIQVQVGKGNNAEGTVEINRCKFSNLFDADGADAAIRSVSSSTASLSVDSCVIWRNFGGGIRWQSLIAPAAQISNTIIKGNLNTGSGGGIFAKAGIALSNCKITNNTSMNNGGGINYITYDEGSTQSVENAGRVYPKSLNLAMDATTVIDGNKAINGYGGGICIEGGFIYLGNNVGAICYEYDDNGQNPQTFKISMNQNGATISNNEAKQDGGGVYISRKADATFYQLECNLTYGTISGNKTSSGNGGGVSVNTPSTYTIDSRIPSSTVAALVPQDVTVTVGRAGETANKMTIKNDTAILGGGIYVEAYPVTYNGTTSMVTTTLYDGTDIKDNIANVDGGGFYVKQGLVTIQSSGNSNKPTIQHNTATTGSGGGLYLFSGTVNMTNALLGGDNTSLGNTANQYGGGLYVNTGSVTMESTTIQYNKAENQSGGGIFVESGDVLINPNENETTSPTKIDHNIANLNGGGLSNRQGKVVIFGSFNGDNTYPVEITNNIATTGSGGGIFCIGDGTSSDYDIRMRRVKILGNKATTGTGTTIGTSTVDNGCGGGIYLQEGKISIINGKLLENQANVSGGGVYTHSGDIDINPTREERQPSQITGNTANINGGGLNTHSGKITVLGNDKDHRIIIKNNTATTGSGGGVFCMGENSSDEYITMRHADLINNKAENGGGSAGTDVTPGCGGGMYLQQGIISITDVNIQNNYAKVNGGGINNHSGNIDVDGCFIGSSHSTSGDHYYKADAGDDTDRGNKADQSGGGIYTHAGDIDIEDYMETSGSIFREESKVAFNEAAENGGGINTHQGTITINGKEMDDQIEISFNKANKGGGMYANAGTINAYNALIRDNTATQNGGGINNHSGNIALYGGILSNNTAELGHGGGAYTNVGDIDLFQFPSSKLIDVTLEDGTKVYNNIALKNGGAFNNHTGRVDIRHATLYNNTSTQGNGGAIFCEGPHANVNRGLGYTIRLLCSDMVQNKTRGQDGTEADPTGRGGGVYLKYGSIYAHYSNIRDNEANIAGGGLNNHEGNILLYGCDITGNRALELDGGGIFIKSGSITTGPSTERVASPTRAKATTVQKNTAYRNGGGIINLDGDITLNGDLIGGTTTNDGNIAHNGDGGGVYIANGTINMKGGKIAYNTANSGNGGGVYSGGGQFNIEKRDDNPKPITLIVDVEVKRDGGGQNATVHYHLVDQGKYGVEVTNVKHGIVWGEGTPSTTVTYGETSGYTYAQGEPACQRITIPSITADKTYKVKSFFEYDYSSSTYTGYSDEMEFITYSATLPTVISGTVSNITKNSAEGSGKIQDNGGSDITARGVQLWTGSSTPPGDPTGTLHASSDETDFFTVSLTSLLPNTTYYARAYATNGSGTAYGATVEFKTLKDTPDMGSGPLTVTTDINSVGQIVVTASYTMPSGTTFGTGSGEVQGYGFVWSTDDDPELYADHTIAGVLSSGTTFTAQYVGAREGIAAYVRAYATYEESAVTSTSDPTNYSITKPKQFFTPYLNGDPVVRAIRISGITQNSATVTCKIYSGYNYGGATTVYGVHLENDNSYHSSLDYNTADSTYTVTLTGLNVNTTYYLKAYATNDSGTTYSYGNGYNFTTLPISLPHVVITSISDITKTAANINCEVTDGGGTITAYGVKWGTDNPPTQHDASQSGAPASNPFTIALPDGSNTMTEHTTYYVQAYATNSAGTHTCPVVSFTTNYDKPTVNNLTVSNSATPDGTNVNATADFKVAAHSTNAIDEVKTYGVCWSIFHNPTRSKSEVSDTDYAETSASISSTDLQDCSQNMKQKFPNTKYYVRAYASTKTPVGGNLTDTVYSSEASFITLPAMVTESASNIGKTSATLSGQIASRDSEGYLVDGFYGVCWGTSANPERQTSPANYTEQQITSANASAFNYSLATATLTSNTEYHFRAYFRHASGNIAYGADQTFHTKQYGVTASANPAAGGTTSVYYNANGTTCTVNATANTGYTFTNWKESGSVVSTSAEYEVTIGSTDHDLEANFTLNNYTVTVVADPAAGGTVSGGGSYAYGSNRTVTASANSGYAFVNWTDENGEEVSTETSYTFTVTGTTTLTAHFDAIITVTISPDGTGTVTGAGNYSVGSTCTLEAIHESGYHFVNWTEGGSLVSTDATYSFTVLANRTLVANFEADPKSRSTTPRSRDIYPAPAREPWDWDDDEVVIAREVRPKQSTHKANVLDCHASLAMTENATACGLAMTEDGLAMTDTLPSAIDSLIQLREQMERDAVEPANIPSIDHNSAEYGGGIFMEYTDKTHASAPTKLVFTGGAKTDPVKGQINFNYASEAGGGIYISDSAYMQMKWHCEVNANRVPEGKRGGGIYLKGRLYVGNEETDVAGTHGLIVNKNYAVNVSDADFATNYAAIVNGSASADTTNKYKKNLNNVFLTRYESDFVNNWEDSDYDDLATVITLLSDISGKDGGTNKPYSNIGFSVLRGFCPVIATSASLWGPYVNTNTAPPLNPDYEEWLYNLMKSSKDGISGFDENGALFEDSETYVAIHTRTKSQPFLPKYIYLWGCWTYPAVKVDPESNRPMVGSTSPSNPASDSQWLGHYVITENNGILHWDIYSEEGLSWFSSYVNGLNVFKTGDTHHDAYDAAKNPYATATLMNDVDLRSHIWTPIGSVTSFQDTNLGGSSSLFTDDPNVPHHFKGSFDGQGHTIKGMNVRYVSGIYKYGLFGYLDDAASVKNVFIDDSEFITDSDIESYHVGGVAGLVTSGNGKNIVISASEARVQIDVSSAKKATSYVGGLVGKVEGAGTTTIHSSMAMPEIKGSVKQVGGLVGELTAGNKLYNSFANPKFPDAKYADTIRTGASTVTDSIYFGGLVGINHGIVDNCYSRLQGTEPLGDGKQTGKTIYGWFAGTNNGTIQNSYALKPTSGTRKYIRRTTSPGNTAPTNHGTYTATSRVSGKYGFKHRDQQLEAVSTATYITNDNNDTLVGGLLMAMNAWVNAKNKALTDASQLPMYHPWMRTMASTINDDLPIPNFKKWTTTKAIVEDELYNAVGSKDGNYIDYKTDVNVLLTEYTALDPAVYHDPYPDIYLYNADNATTITQTNIGTTHPNIKFHINEDVGILQNVDVNATVGITFDNSNRSTLPELGGKPYDWHMFGSAVNNVALGLRYHTDEEATSDDYHVWKNYTSDGNYKVNGIPNTVYNGSATTYDREKMDPPRTYFHQTDNSSKPGYTTDKTKLGYFPSNTPYGSWRDKSASEVATLDGFSTGSFDFYCYGEKVYQHWINFKRRGDASFYDHWRQDPTEDGHHLNIPYDNEPNMLNGKGYLMAVSERSMLMAEGTLNNGTVSYAATYTTNPSATVYDEMVRGTNLIGNPFQSYLDFTEFAANNSGILAGGDAADYYILDADSLGYISYTAKSSFSGFGATRYIHPHQGFLVRVTGGGTLNFTEGMRVAGKYSPSLGNSATLYHANFRDEQINYPLVNLLCFDADGKRDYTTVEINRPDVGGGQKMKGLRFGNALIYARWEGIDYQTAFTPEGISEVPVRFEAFDDQVFTIKWGTLHGDFHYLHLIDNLTGADVDMLRATEYRFEGRTTDYASRFKLVFNVTGIEEPDDPAPPLVATSFAFQFGDELIVTGEGTLQMFDLNGRCLLSTKAVGEQSSVSLPSVAAGMYMLRLTGNTQTRVQKIIIK